MGHFYVKKKNNSWKDIFNAIVLPLVLVGVITGGPIYLVFAGVIMYFFTLNKYEISVVLMTAFPHVLGMVKDFVGISMPASAILFSIVLLLLNTEINKLFNRRVLFVLLFSVALFISICLLYFLNAPSSSGYNKLIDTLLTIICVNTAFSLILTNDNISLKRIGVGYLFVACMYLWLAYNVFLYPHPSSLIDFSSFRDFSTQLKHIDAPNISYHHLGYCGFYFLSFLLAEDKKKLSIYDIVVLVISIWITMYAGGRQIMVGVALMFLLLVLIRRGRNMFSSILLVGFLLVVSWGIFSNLEVFADFMDSSTNTDEKLNRNWGYAINQFPKHPLLGVGYGNYKNPYTGEIYPHNIVLEILCELGLVGFLIISLVVYFAILSSKPYNHNMSFNKIRGIMIFFPYLLHGFISGSLGTNIQVFVIFFALIVSSGFQSNPKNCNILGLHRNASITSFLRRLQNLPYTGKLGVQ